MDYKTDKTCRNGTDDHFGEGKLKKDFFVCFPHTKGNLLWLETLYELFVKRRKDWIDDLWNWGLKGVKGKGEVLKKEKKNKMERLDWKKKL